MSRIVIAVIVACIGAASSQALQSPANLCPPGQVSMFNVNRPGCTFCYEETQGCEVQCLGAPTCVCEPGDTECCAASPCCENCPEPKPLSCDTSSCSCDPTTCCSTVCPAPAPAPVSSVGGLAALAVGLLVLGATAVRFAARR